MSSLLDLFRASLVDRAGHPGLEWRGERTTFGALAARAGAVALALEQRGIREGDRLVVYLVNQPAWIEIYLACVALGVTVVPMNVLYRDREVQHILEDAQPRAVVADGDVPGAAGVPVWQVSDVASPSLEAGQSDISHFLQLGDRHRSGEVRASTPPALIVYTSGTTGQPKGAVLTHANLVANAENLVEAWRITADDRLLLALPLFHVHGLGNGIHCWLASGCTMRLEERFVHDQAVRWFDEFEPTLFFGVPTIYTRLVEIHPAAARRIGARTRLFVSGSAPLPAATFERFEELFGHRILERYGMSETLMTLSNPLHGERRPGSVGVPLPRVSILIVDPETGAPTMDGAAGELLVQSPTVCAGYWGREEATRAAFLDGWFRTGDLAERSADGYITLRGRRSDLIISGGFNIYPREIEEFLLEQPEIADVAVKGVPDVRRGELPVAFIVPAPGATIDAADLARRCGEHLASFKVPRRFVQVESLPRNALGKVQKHLLKLQA